MDFHHGSVATRPIWKRGESSRTRDHDMTFGQSEKSLDVGFVCDGRIPLPGHAPVEPELPMFSDGANDADVTHLVVLKIKPSRVKLELRLAVFDVRRFAARSMI
jgi:hypothetical protein